MLLIENIENRLLQVNPLSIFNPHNPKFYNHQHIAQTRIRIILTSIHSAQLLPCIVSTKIIIVLKYSALFFNKNGLFYPICLLYCSYSALRCNSLYCVAIICIVFGIFRIALKLFRIVFRLFHIVYIYSNIVRSHSHIA